MTDSLSGHTAAQNNAGADGLRDGDALSSASLSNMLQGINGNGIVRLQDGAFASTRNAVDSQPGSVLRGTGSNSYKLTITGGYVRLDGVLYEFAGGPEGTANLELGNTGHGSGGVALAASGEEILYVIYVACDRGLNKVHYEGGSPVNVSNGLFPSIPSQFLTDYDTANSQTNMKTHVLAVVRAKYKASGGGNHNLEIVEVNDKRVFLPVPVHYMPIMSKGDIGSNKITTSDGTNAVNTFTDLNSLHTEQGNVTINDSIVALWPSYPSHAAFSATAPASGAAGFGHAPSHGRDIASNHVKNALYFSGLNNEGTGHYSVRLDGRGVEASQTEITGNPTFTITADGDSFIMSKVATGTTLTLNPQKDASGNYMFPEGHIIEVCNEGAAGKGDIIFDATELNTTLSPTERATFVYEGSKWMTCNYPAASSVRTVTAGGNTLDPSETLAFTAGSNVTITEAGGAVTIAATDTDTNTFRTVTAGGNTLGATETLAFTAGSNVTITEAGGAVTIASTDTDTNTFRTVTAGGNTLGASETLAFTAGSNVTITEAGGAVTIAASGGTVDVVSNVATNTILGRNDAGSGDSEELTPTEVRTMLNVADGATAYADADAIAANLKDFMLLNMVASSANIASGGNYDVAVGNPANFVVTATRGASIATDPVTTNKIDLAGGLYQITFNGWVQTVAAISGSLDYQFKVSTDPTFAASDISYDRKIAYYGATASVTAIIDPSHTVMFNTAAPASIYIRVTLSNGNSQQWYLRGAPADQLTNVQIVRISEPV